MISDDEPFAGDWWNPTGACCQCGGHIFGEFDPSAAQLCLDCISEMPRSVAPNENDEPPAVSSAEGFGGLTAVSIRDTLRRALKRLGAVLLDPEGEVSIDGSEADRKEVGEAMDSIGRIYWTLRANTPPAPPPASKTIQENLL